MTEVTFTFTYKSPNGEGNPDPTDYTVQNWTYIGPEILYVVVDEDTGKVNGGTWYTDPEVNAPPENRIVVVRAEDQPTLASILVGCLDDDHIRTVLVNSPNGQTVEDHEYVSLAAAYSLDCFDYNFSNSQWSETWNSAQWNTWDEIRQMRNHLLSTTDSRVRSDMPDSVKQVWIDYRTSLRDITTNWADYAPWQVEFPIAPG